MRTLEQRQQHYFKLRPLAQSNADVTILTKRHIIPLLLGCNAYARQINRHLDCQWYLFFGGGP